MIKALHMTVAFISVTGFVMRFAWRFSDPEMLQLRFVRIVPHMVDTLLLTLGVVLLIQLDAHSYTWLVAKFFGLLLYIAMGVVALRAQGPLCFVGFAAALLAVGYIFAVAFSRQVLPFV